MFKYGHMLEPHDKLYIALKNEAGVIVVMIPVQVLDIWGTGDNLWAELWTFRPDDIARPVMVKRIRKFSHFHLFDPHEANDLFVGASRDYAPAID